MEPQTKIKVCHLTSAHADGDVRIFHKECASLSSEGFETSLIVPNTESRKEKGVQIISFVSEHKSRRERMTKTVARVLEEAIKVDADVYHFHDPELLKIVKKLRQLGKKVVYDVHEDLPRQILSKHWIPKLLRKAISIYTEKYENRIAKKCDGIVTATPFIRDRFLKINKNTVDINNFPILEELLMDFEYMDKTEDLVCYVGGITKTRGIHEIVKSLNGKDYSLLLAGKFLEENLRDTVITYDGWGRVEELGFLDREGVKEVYKKAKVGLVTLHPIINYIDALPVKMFEYMAAGLPVVASDFPLWRSIVAGNKCGLLVDPLNANDVARAVEELIANPEQAKEMGLNGKKAVIEQYNWQIEKEKLIKFYNRLTKL